jgi:hypothetical protein
MELERDMLVSPTGEVPVRPGLPHAQASRQAWVARCLTTLTKSRTAFTGQFERVFWRAGFQSSCCVLPGVAACCCLLPKRFHL